MTPSKSNTIARSILNSLFLLLHSLAGANRNLQSVLRRWIRALVGGVVVAVRNVGAVEVDFVDAGRVARQIHETTGGIRFGSARQIAERDEQGPGVGADLVEGEQLQRL